MHRSRYLWGADDYKAKQIVSHRRKPDGTFEFEVEWEPHEETGETYENSFEPKKFLTRDLLRAYGWMDVPPILVTVDAVPLITMVRQSIAKCVTDKRTQCRPRVHVLEIPELALEPLARAFLAAMSTPWQLAVWGRSRSGAVARPLEITEEIDETDGVVTMQLEIKKQEDIDCTLDFANFIEFGATRCLRYSAVNTRACQQSTPGG